MTKQLIVAVLVLVLLALGGTIFLNSRSQPKVVACTMEAKLCPDGSYVGRSGPNCEFTNCPDVKPAPVDTGKASGTITGVVTLGPTCPVERMPPDPQCAPRPYDGFMDIVHAGYNSVSKTVETGLDGKFTAVVPPGSYELHMRNKTNSILPRCEVVTVQVEEGKITNIPISCDTGIR